MDAGKLVPDEVIIGIINERLQEADCANGYILDGVPRTIAQAEAMEQAGISFDAVVAIEIPDEKIVARMGGTTGLRELRRQLSHREHPSQKGRRVRCVRRQARAA